MKKIWSWLIVLGLSTPLLGEQLGHLSAVLDLASHFLLTSASLSLLVAAFFFLVRRPAEAVASLAVFCVGLWLIGPWLATTEIPATAGKVHSALVLNVYYDNEKLEQLDVWASQREADILILLEVKPHVWQKLRAVIEMYPYRIDCWKERACDALVLSRYPLIDKRSSLPKISWRQPFSVSEVRLEDRGLTLFAAHFSLPAILEGEEKHEFDALSVAILRTSGPTLIAGDFNAAAWSAKMKSLSASTGVRVATGPEATWPSFLPSFMGIPIDHVLASEDVSIHSRQVLAVPGSDHRAIEVKFTLPPQAKESAKVE